MIAALFTIRVDAASLFDPSLRFRTLTTEHFSIHFHQGEDALAARLAHIAESVWQSVAASLHTAAPRKTHVVLADQTELANGWATPLPHNLIFITAATPSGSEYIGRTDDWLRLVFTHEFTHIVHLDRSEGWARVFRNIFGRTPVAFPNLWLPAWQIEGLATWQESVSTGAGRLHAGAFRAIERQAAREDRVPPLDRVNGGLTDWPDGLAPYAFGLGFHQYLASRFGEERFGELASETARRLPFLGSTAFGRVYGASLGALWDDYTKALTGSVGSERGAVGTARRLTHHGHMVMGPRFLPPACETCATEIAYSARNPNGFPALRAVALDGSGSRELATRYLGSTMGVASGMVIFDQQDLRRNVALQSDLHLFDRRTRSTRALTRGQRLQDPDLSPDGFTIACVRQNRDRRDLVLARLASDSRNPTDLDRIEITEMVTLLSDADTQFNAPRWSPDGKTLVVERQRLAALTEIVLVHVDTRAIQVVAASSTARFVTPTWRPDGRAIVAAADLGGGPFNLYEYPLNKLPSRPSRLTHTPGGALWPDLAPDGKTIVFAGYTADGFDVFVMPYPDGQPGIEPDVDVRPTRPRLAAIRRATPPTAPYVPWGTLQPTSWMPILETGTDYARAGIATSGHDVLARHAYAASATWLISGPDDVDHARARPDWSVAYAYDRWQPTVFISSSRTTFFAAGEPDEAGRPTPGTLRETEVEAGILLPFRRVRRSDQAVASVVHTEGRFISETENLSGARTAFRLGAATSGALMYGYSVSPEHGVTAGATAELVPRAADNAGAAILTADLRVFVPGIRPHHVVALRAAGGMASGEHGLRRRFLMGGAGPDSSVLNFGRTAFSLLRAFPDQAFTGTRGGLVNVDYRWPIARPQRGAGTWPLLLHTIHAAAFADAGHVWSDRFRAADVKTSLGGELSVNLIAGYSFAFTLTGGAAWGRDGAQHRGSRAAYVRIGRAF